MSQNTTNSSQAFLLTPNKLDKLLAVLKKHNVKSFNTSSFSLTFDSSYDMVEQYVTANTATQTYGSDDDSTYRPPASPEELDEQIRNLG